MWASKRQISMNEKIFGHQVVRNYLVCKCCERVKRTSGKDVILIYTIKNIFGYLAFKKIDIWVAHF